MKNSTLTPIDNFSDLLLTTTSGETIRIDCETAYLISEDYAEKFDDELIKEAIKVRGNNIKDKEHLIDLLVYCLTLRYGINPYKILYDVVDLAYRMEYIVKSARNLADNKYTLTYVDYHAKLLPAGVSMLVYVR